MQPIQISLVPLGNLKYPVSIAEIEAWRSQIISIKHGASVGSLPNAKGHDWEYPDNQLLEVLRAESGSDFTLGLINASLEDNYYLRRLSDNVAVLSLFEMADIVKYSGSTVEQYILCNAYYLAVLFSENKKIIPENYGSLSHDDTRGCLFDMNANKSDILASLDRPVLCLECRKRVSEKQVPPMLLPILDKELRWIQKARYVRITEWIKSRPITALVITALSGIAINLIASFIFEKVKSAFSWLS